MNLAVKKVLPFYIINLLIYCFFAFWFDKEFYNPVFFTGFFLALISLIIVALSPFLLSGKRKFYELAIIVSIVVFVFWGINLFLFQDVTNNLFEFTYLGDSVNYSKYGMQVESKGLVEGIVYFNENTKYGYDDSGFVFLKALLYRINNNEYFVRFINIIVHIITLYYLYSIGKKTLSYQNNYLLVLVYGISSFSIFYISSGLKETFFTFFVTWIIYLLITRKRGHLFWVFLLLIIVISSFRMVTTLFLITAFLLRKFKFSKKNFIIFISFFALVYVLINNNLSYFDFLFIHLRNENLDYIQDQSLGTTKYILPIFLGFFGPFPYLLPTPENYENALWSSTLSIKAFLGIFFIFGGYYINKYFKNYNLTFILYFVLLNVFSLILVDQTFKLRYFIPFLPFFYIISFYGIENLKKRFEIPANIITILISLLIVFWNVLKN